MPTLEASGTLTATVNVEATLATISTSRVLVLVVDTSNMVNGDTLELRLYSTVLVGGTEFLAYVRRFKHAQSEPIKFSIPVPSDIEARATLDQTTGTGRQFAWKILSL